MFPEKTAYLKRPKGWENLGRMEGSSYSSEIEHKFCGRTLHIGKEDNKIFQFCPRCLIKVKTQE